MFLCQSGIWPILCQLMAILAKLLDMDFKFVFSRIYINFDIQTKFEVDLTQIGHSISENSFKNVGGVGFLVNDTWGNWVLRYGQFGEFLEYFWG